MKNVISRRYYPVYHGRSNTTYSYRSLYIGGTVRSGSADVIVGTVPTDIPNGWVCTPAGNPLRGISLRKWIANNTLPEGSEGGTK
jgi:hypothetical protein